MLLPKLTAQARMAAATSAFHVAPEEAATLRAVAPVLAVLQGQLEAERSRNDRAEQRATEWREQLAQATASLEEVRAAIASLVADVAAARREAMRIEPPPSFLRLLIGVLIRR